LLLQLSRFLDEHGCVLHKLDCGLAQGFSFTSDLLGSWLVRHPNYDATADRDCENLKLRAAGQKKAGPEQVRSKELQHSADHPNHTN
jgi:hypothetical protein